MPAGLLPALVAIMFVASLVQGAIGFGFGLVAVAAVSLLCPLRVGTPLMAIANVPVVVYVFFRLRRHVLWRRLTPIVVGQLLGIPFGIFVLVHWPQSVLLRILGTLLLTAAIKAARGNNATSYTGARERHGITSVMGRLGVGAASGALAGAFNTGGPPIIAYVYSRPWSKEERTATLQAVFVISLAARIILMASAGLYTLPLVGAALACVPGVIVGMFVGYALFRRIPARALEIVVTGFLVVVGLKLLIWAE